MKPRLLAPLLCAAGIALVVSCGARTDLDYDEPVASGDSGLDADADAAVTCTPGEFTLDPADPAVMLLLDRSKSMDTAFERNGESRWEVLTNALASSLPPVDNTISLGALLFPDVAATDSMSCSAPSAPNLLPALGNVSSIVSLMRTSGVNGATPTADAVQVAGAALLGFRAASTARAMVLATDGGPNCNDDLDPRTCRCVDGACNQASRCLDDVRTVSRITDLTNQGIPTYVIGIESMNDTSNEDVLDAMAVAGGRPQTNANHSYYQATSSTELSAALVTIRNQVGACTYLTRSVPGVGGTITLTLGGVTVPYDPTGATGWRWADQANGEILFAGDLCAKVAAATSPPIVDVSCTAAKDAGSDADADADAADADDDAGDAANGD